MAEELGSRSSDDGALRTAISRSYYYIFHLALERASGNGFVTVKGESSHLQLWNLFTKSPEPTCLNLGQIALRLKEKRQRADYDNHFARLADEISPVLEETRMFATLLSNLAPRHPNPNSIRQ
ncbi:MAG TPA: hypothetical protein VKG25_13945 [Bryobacteraceae bacterium]|nr:hypothetical protein [Bryobacteraceae bacterium]